MNPEGSAANLIQALKVLRLEWEQTGQSWGDAKRLEFEQNYLETLPNDVMRASVVMKEIAAVLRKIRDDCE